MAPQRKNGTPTQKWHPNAKTSPQRKNVTPAQKCHPSVGWGLKHKVRKRDTSLRWYDGEKGNKKP
jgi:hypothetical protein